MFSDNKMIYDKESHMYILTKEYLENSLNVNLLDVLNHDMSIAPDKDSEIFLERVSNLLYTYLLDYSNNPSKTQYYLAMTDNIRNYIARALLETAYAIILNNKEIGIFYSDNEIIDLVPENVKSYSQSHGLLWRGNIYGIPEDYLDSMGEDW